MKTYKRICIRDVHVFDRDGKQHKIKRGQEVITTEKKNGELWVLSMFWVEVPSSYFEGEVKHT